MGRQEIVDRIISDATEEADRIIAAAEQSAAEMIAQANASADSLMGEMRMRTEERAKSISDGRAAAARLDGAKILLGEKRRVIDVIYALAAEKLGSLSAASCLKLAERLISEYAEDGDEIIFSKDFPCAEQVCNLKAVADKKLKVSFKKAEIDGGFILCGKKSDKDLSFGALLAADRAEHEAEIAAEIFK